MLIDTSLEAVTRHRYCTPSEAGFSDVWLATQVEAFGAVDLLLSCTANSRAISRPATEGRSPSANARHYHHHSAAQGREPTSFFRSPSRARA
jgi:hypothetical protein